MPVCTLLTGFQVFRYSLAILNRRTCGVGAAGTLMLKSGMSMTEWSERGPDRSLASDHAFVVGVADR